MRDSRTFCCCALPCLAWAVQVPADAGMVDLPGIASWLPETLHSEQRFLLIGAGLLVLLLLTGLVRILFARSKGDCILLLGPPGAGKTTLFLQLRDGTCHNGTVMSLIEADERCQLAGEKGTKARSFQLVDVPGHPRVRHKFEQHMRAVRGVVFVVDAHEASFLVQRTDTAEQLLDVLTSLHGPRRGLQLCIACNKADHGPKAHTVDFIRKRLEKEIEQLRTTRKTVGEQADASALGPDSRPFSFEGMAKARRWQTRFASISAQDGEVGPVADFIRTCVPP